MGAAKQIRDDAFGRYCFPQKLFESLACAIPVVAAAVGATARVLALHPRSLYVPGNTESLEMALRSQLAAPEVAPLRIPTWLSLAGTLRDFFAALD